MSQVIVVGIKEIFSIKKILKKNHVETVLVVTGKKSFTNSSAKEKLEHILKEFKVIRFFEFEENPKINDVKKGIKIFNDNKCQAIIAIGGGSVIDMAKLINGYNSYNSNIEKGIRNNEIGNELKPFIAIPTTAGSGSESTHFAVVYVGNVKYSVSNEKLLPNYIYLIPEFTYTATGYLTAVTGLDAFAQAMESWWSINSTHESISFSSQALELIWDNLLIAIKENDPKAKAMMMQAANLAGKAINITKTTAPHALSYGFTTFCGLPHGHSVAIFLPNFIKLHIEATEQDCNDSRGIEWIKAIMINISSVLNIELDKLAIEVVKFINECGISINFKDLEISNQLFEESIGNYSKERLKNNPVKVDNDFITNLFNSELNKY
jgi:alcohol dehydrogenase class IV